MKNTSISRIIHGIAALIIVFSFLWVLSDVSVKYISRTTSLIVDMIAAASQTAELEERYLETIKDRNERIKALQFSVTPETLAASDIKAKEVLTTRGQEITDLLRDNEFNLISSGQILSAPLSQDLTKHEQAYTFAGPQKSLTDVICALNETEMVIGDLTLSRAPDELTEILLTIAFVSFETTGITDDTPA